MSTRQEMLLALVLLCPLTASAQDRNEEFFAAARKGDAVALKALLDAGVDVNAKTRYGATALSYACDKGHVEVVKLLIERGADVNVKDTFYGEVPLGWALSHGHAQVVKLLLDKGAAGIERALMSGVQDGNAEIVKVALEKGGLKPETLNNALRRASSGGNKEIVELLKKAGAVAVEVTVDPEVLKSYKGLYKNNQVGELTVEVREGKLSGRVNGQAWFTTSAISKNIFAIIEVEATITFNTCDVQKNSFIAAYDLKDGKQLWMTPREEIPSWGTPTIYEGPSRVELITNATRAARAYDPMTGKELWKLTGNPEVTATTPVTGHGLIFICNSYRPNQPIYAIRAGATGDISLKPNETSNQHVAWSMQRGGTYMPSPLIYGEYLYTCANHGVMACYNPKTGERVYQQRIGDKGGAYSASPVAADGKIYLSSEDGEISVVKAGAKYELLATNQMGEVLMATPAISDGMIFVRGQHNVFAIAERGAASAAK